MFDVQTAMEVLATGVLGADRTSGSVSQSETRKSVKIDTFTLFASFGLRLRKWAVRSGFSHHFPKILSGTTGPHLMRSTHTHVPAVQKSATLLRASAKKCENRRFPFFPPRATSDPVPRDSPPNDPCLATHITAYRLSAPLARTDTFSCPPARMRSHARTARMRRQLPRPAVENRKFSHFSEALVGKADESGRPSSGNPMSGMTPGTPLTHTHTYTRG
jgi:hypothetical protein